MVMFVTLLYPPPPVVVGPASERWAKAIEGGI
jgi:hypothetical protein